MLYIRLWRTYSSYVIIALYPLTSISLPPHIFPPGSAFMYLAFLDSSYKWGGSGGQESDCIAGDLGMIPRSGRYSGEGNG